MEYEEDINAADVKIAQNRVDQLDTRLSKLRLNPSPSFDNSYFETAKVMHQTSSRKSLYNLRILQWSKNIAKDEERLANP